MYYTHLQISFQSQVYMYYVHLFFAHIVCYSFWFWLFYASLVYICGMSDVLINKRIYIQILSSGSGITPFTNTNFRVRFTWMTHIYKNCFQGQVYMNYAHLQKLFSGSGLHELRHLQILISGSGFYVLHTFTNIVCKVRFTCITYIYKYCFQGKVYMY